MERRSFKRAALYSIFGGLLFLLVQAILCGLINSLKNVGLFKANEFLDADLIIIALKLRYTIFVIIGFIAGFGYYLFEDRITRKRKKTE